MSYTPKIAIIGGGPGGLTLANLLQKSKVPFTIYEATDSPRHQGGSLDLHPHDGQEALRQAGLWDAFVKYARPESDVMKVVNIDGQVLWDGNGPDAYKPSEEEKFNHRPEIDRAMLMKILLQNIEPASLKYSKKVVEITSAGQGKHDIHFADGTIARELDLIVGADGAWSKVRALLSDVKPYYSGVSGVEVWKMDVEKNDPWLAEYSGQGNCFCFGKDRTIQMQRHGDGSLRIYGFLRQPQNFLEDCGIDWSMPKEALNEYVKAYYGDAGTDLQRALLACTDSLVTRKLYMLPVGFKYDHKPGLTLLGDAAHLMTPFAGVGVNAAMADAIELANAITAAARDAQQHALVRTIEEYEDHMFTRGAKFAQKTSVNLISHFSEEGSQEFASKFQRRFGSGSQPILA